MVFRKLNTLKRSSLAQNALALTALQASGNLATLISLPYLTRTMGPSAWGEVAWIQVILGYLVIVVDMGLSWHGTSQISKLRNDRGSLSRAFKSGWILQILCAILVGFLFYLSVINGLFGDVPDAYGWWGATYLVSVVLFPGWLPGGLERLKEVAVVQFFVRCLSLPLIFILVKSSTDGPLVIASLAVSGLCGGAFGVLWLIRKVDIDWAVSSRSDLWSQLEAGAHVVVSRLIAVLYSSMIPMLLGVLVGMSAVGLYMVSDRLRAAVLSLINPVGQALLPRLSYLYETDKLSAAFLFKRILIGMSLLCGGFGLVQLIFAQEIAIIVGGKAFEGAFLVLMITASVPLFNCLNNLLLIQFLLPRGLMGISNKFTFIVAICGGVGGYYAIAAFGLVGAATVAVLCEFIIFALNGALVLKYWDLVFGREAFIEGLES